MSSRPARPLRHALRRVAVVGAAGSLVLSGVAVSSAQTAGAAPATQTSAAKAPVKAAKAKSSTMKSTKRKMLNRKALLRYAAKQKGKPYRYGATGPRSFDCSGFTQYVFKSQHRKLPRTSSLQYRKAKKISKRSIKPGDLMFFRNGGRVTHVTIYAGKNKMWAAPHTGSRVKLQKVYSTRWVAGRYA